MGASTGDVLAHVKRALDEFDEVALAVSVRRGIRIANLLGDTEAALRFAFEVKHFGGDPKLNAQETRRLMLDPSRWDDETGPAAEALNAFMADRRLHDGSGKSAIHSLDEIEHLLTLDGLDPETRRFLIGIPQVTRSRLFSYLCAWERSLTAAITNENTLAQHQRRVDEVLAAGEHHLLAQFNAVFRRLTEAASTDRESEASEALSQAVTTCRRILKAVVDVVQPVDTSRTLSENGNALSDAAYKNRLFEFLRTATTHSRGQRTALSSAGRSLWDRFDATDALASKGVHASVARDEAELCALNTYLLAGELLRLASRRA